MLIASRSRGIWKNHLASIKLIALCATALLANAPVFSADLAPAEEDESEQIPFGQKWREIPPPTIKGTNAMAAVEAFITTNGWNMDDGFYIFPGVAKYKAKPIRGLPWEAIQDREFQAVTHDGILYVLLSDVEFSTYRHTLTGVAYNPKTNVFAFGIYNFKHIGQHWYAWERPDVLTNEIQEYEGSVSLPIRRSLGTELPPIEVTCKLKAYRLGLRVSSEPGGIYSEKEFEKLQKSTTNDLRWEVSGFLWEITSPPKFAGKTLSSHFDGVIPRGDPFFAFTFGKQYLMHISEECIGDEHFRLCY